MAKTIKEEINDYLNENDMYFVEEYDRDGFPVNDEADNLIGDMTNYELCELVTDSMEYIAEVQYKKDIKKACDAYCKVCGHFAHSVPTHICRQDCHYYTDFKQAMKEEQ